MAETKGVITPKGTSNQSFIVWWGVSASRGPHTILKDSSCCSLFNVEVVLARYWLRMTRTVRCLPQNIPLISNDTFRRTTGIQSRMKRETSNNLPRVYMEVCPIPYQAIMARRSIDKF